MTYTGVSLMAHRMLATVLRNERGVRPSGSSSRLLASRELTARRRYGDARTSHGMSAFGVRALGRGEGLTDA
jgi:hypothetical protein